MKYLLGAATALIAAVVAAQEEFDNPDGKKYHEFARYMHHWGYKWEAFTVTTEDQYLLTTFRITENKAHKVEPDESLNPVMLMHGLACDATSWLYDWDQVEKPLPLQLFDRGFDVYMASNRGTKYCQQHETLAVDNPDFWAFSWAEMGIYDDVANVKMIKERTGKKVSYVGVSQGTVQMFYALAKLEEEFFADNLFTFAAIDPCTIDVTEGNRIYKHGLFHFSEYGIYAFGGPNWDEDLNTICDNFDQEICDYAAGCAGGEPVSLQTNVHWAQNVVQQRFQEYSPEYMSGKHHHHTDLIDLSQIKKVPVTIWSGLLDNTCYNSQAKITAQEIGERVTYFRTVPWADHGYWGGPLTAGLYKELETRLIDPEKKSYPLPQPAFFDNI